MASKLIRNNSVLRKGVLRYRYLSEANLLFPRGLSRIPSTTTPSGTERDNLRQRFLFRRHFSDFSSILAVSDEPWRPRGARGTALAAAATTTTPAAAAAAAVTGTRHSLAVPIRTLSGGCSQHFENESEYHGVADETLEDIQDAVEMALEDNDIGGDGSSEEQPEVVYASGVLTMAFPPHGTWVLNKQTPNRQIWWSSPISGPKRYEYDPETSEWIDARGSGETLTGAIAGEVEQIYEIQLDL